MASTPPQLIHPSQPAEAAPHPGASGRRSAVAASPPLFRRFELLGVAMYLGLTGALVAATLLLTRGHLVYALDDPYIHLALAENLARGHYGLNPIEYASPSSSILWPLLLMPFAGTRLQAWLPLVWNLLFGCAAAALLGRIVASLPVRRVLVPRSAGVAGEEPGFARPAALLLLLFIANLPSLTMIGMEHVLQVLTAIAVAYGAIEALAGRTIPAWTLAAAFIAPMVRYEDLSLTLALSCALVGARRWKSAAVLFAASIAPLVAFSVFLRSRGMPLLPMSVLAKGHDFASPASGGRILFLIRSVLYGMREPSHYAVIFLFGLFLALTIRVRVRPRRAVYAGAMLLGALQITVGRFGWFHRYEVYALIFLVLVALGAVAVEGLRLLPWLTARLPDRPAVREFYALLALLALTSGIYIAGTLETPSSSQGIYLQQYQMRRFVVDFYDRDYAVNDLGLVSYQRRPGSYVLDLQGLASTVPIETSQRTAAWLEHLVRQHHIDLAIVYPEWFHIPSSWTPMGRMCIVAKGRNHNAEPCVVFYSADPAANQSIHDSLQRFRTTLPQGTVFQSLWNP